LIPGRLMQEAAYVRGPWQVPLLNTLLNGSEQIIMNCINVSW